MKAPHSEGKQALQHWGLDNSKIGLTFCPNVLQMCYGILIQAK